MANNTYDFFISYNKHDLEQATRIVSALKSNNLKCWWQAENSKQKYDQEILNAIQHAAVCIILLSNHSAKSEWVGREILEALRCHFINQCKILPIVVGELDDLHHNFFHQLIGNFNWLDISKYASDRELVLEIGNQVSMQIKPMGEDSIYSSEQEAERARLRKQNELYSLYATPALDEIFAHLDVPAVLDVGSSHAENIMMRLENRIFSHLLCVDKDAPALNEAKERLSHDKRIECMQMDITSEDFLSKLQKYLKEHNLAGFDIIHISAVLLHLKDPLPVLMALHEVLGENGYIFIQDEDDRYNVAAQINESSDSFFRDCFYIWEQSKESGDRYMGNKIPLYLAAAGYHDIQMKASVMTSLDFDGMYKEIMWDLYFNPTLWVVDSPDYFYREDAFALCAPYANKHAKEKAKYMAGETFLALGVPIFVAKK